VSGRIDERGASTARRRASERARPLAAVPAVVAAALHAVDLFEGTLPDISDPQISGPRVETPAPRIAESPSVYLRAVLRSGVIGRTRRIAAKWIAGRPSRNRVRCAAVHVEPQEVAQQVRGVLSMAVRVAAGPAVAEADVQKTIRTESDVAAVVILERLVDTNDVLAATGVQREPVVRALEASDHRHHRRSFGERNVRLAIRRPARMERHPEQSALRVRVHGQRQKRARSTRARRVREHADARGSARAAALLEHEPTRVVAWRLQQSERLIESQARERALQRDRCASVADALLRRDARRV
jgi:hypothetical protein